MFLSQRLPRGLAYVVAAMLACQAACAPRRPLAPGVPPHVPAPSSDTLLDALAARRRQIHSLRGLAHVEYSDPHDQGSAKQAVAVAAPDRFRLEVFSLIGIASLSVCDGQQVAAYFPKEKLVYRGTATPLNIARFIRLPLSARNVAGLLLGVPDLPLTVDRGTVDYAPATGWYRLTVDEADHGTHVLWFEYPELLLRRLELRAPTGATVFTVVLNDYRLVGTLRFPFVIEVSNLSAEQHATVRYEEVELNPPLPDSLFRLGRLPGVKEIALDAPPHG